MQFGATPASAPKLLPADALCVFKAAFAQAKPMKALFGAAPPRLATMVGSSIYCSCQVLLGRGLRRRVGISCCVLLRLVKEVVTNWFHSQNQFLTLPFLSTSMQADQLHLAHFTTCQPNAETTFVQDIADQHNQVQLTSCKVSMQRKLHTGCTLHPQTGPIA